ncbi:AAA family ATPase [Mesorhizobium huakuii]|uniref:AAA family ATPase n=1 Tax=Mesorhizobium huakuii TaxID=28104 RepID=UPI0024E0F30A|nr:AAA family ATPase [Mesorhizobium huakuii]
MTESQPASSNTDFKASSPPVVQEFSIEGLFGYRTVRLYSEYAATVLIARNGSGKTTLLAALDAFLKTRFIRLANLEFSTIRCRFGHVDQELVLHRSDIIDALSLTQKSEIAATAIQYGINSTALQDFVGDEYILVSGNTSDLMTSEVFRSVYNKTSSIAEAKKIFDRLSNALFSKNKNIMSIIKSVREALRGIEVVYLPTYRRIELPLELEADGVSRQVGRRSSSAKIRVPPRSLFTADIQFGLSDISRRLSELNQEILFESNAKYREISANIINELIDGTFDRDDPASDDIPDRESLMLFFSRLKEGPRYGPFQDVAIPKIDKIYGETDLSYGSNKFLFYFLGKLNKPIEATRGIESPVEDFILSCNKYLCSLDLSTSLSWGVVPDIRHSDAKELRLNRKNMMVEVHSISPDRKISLDALSSGEKQMISLFAKIYLYKKQKIVLIDEPELSLSIDWQKQILVDVISAPSCQQVVAITHSPFVFDNELEPYARPLEVIVDPLAMPADVDEGEISE